MRIDQKDGSYHSGIAFCLTNPEAESLHEWLSTAQKAINRQHHHVVPITNPVVRRIWAELDAQFGDKTEGT